MINLVFSMLGPLLTPEQEQVFQGFARWVVLNERNGRLLVDGIGPPAAVATVMELLADRAPILIGGWDMGGQAVEGFPLGEVAWLDVAPDEVDETDPENPVVRRPTQYRQTHGWAGWGLHIT